MNCRTIAFLVLLSAILKQTVTRADQTIAATTNTYTVRGVVREIAPDHHTALIRHEAIPNYMPAMTMNFNVRDTNELSGVRSGDTISFRLTATDDAHWIDQVYKTGAATSGTVDAAPRPSALKIAELKPGDMLPDYELLAENGKPIRFSDFRGKALAFTFIFTRCPLPDFCPRMGQNFAKARELVLAMANAPTNWQFLSISFDPDFDKPNVLSSYADFYRKGNADHWLFAAAPMNVLAELAPQLDLMVNRDPGGSISHNLRTVVLDPKGRIYRQFDGNDWRPQQLAESLIETARGRNHH